MAQFKIFKTHALPTPLAGNALYFVANAATPDHVEIYVTTNDGAAAKRIHTQADIDARIAAALSTNASLEVVADIAARDALAPTKNTQVFVLDASADASVDAGAASYIFTASDTTWHKTSEFESLDVALNWASIVDGPSSTGPQVDAAVAASHSHTNAAQLDKIGEDASGNLTYNGALPASAWDEAAW